jgi:hypothetical protein
MNLSDKTITILGMSVITYPEETTVKVSVSQEVIPGVFKVLDTYDLKIERAFMSTQDPALLLAINEILQTIPD